MGEHIFVLEYKECIYGNLKWPSRWQVFIKKPGFLVHSFGLLGFELSKKDFSADVINMVINKSNLPEEALERMLKLQPVIVNSYNRSYFLSANKKFRITIDDELIYYNLRPSWNYIYDTYKERLKTVVELKYDKEFDDEASSICNQFPFRLDKNSKFVAGMSHFRSEIAE